MSASQAGLALEARTEPIRTGLLGRDILASRSPWMHQEEARAQALDLSYELFDFGVRDWGDADLGEKLKAIADQGFVGVNVTHPFKQKIIDHLDDLSDAARKVGAVNTVRFEGGRSIGHNTDISGFSDSMREGLAGVALNRVVQFGAGGAGSATAHALLSLGVDQLTLVDVDMRRASDLATSLTAAWPSAVIAIRLGQEVELEDANGVVNATPVGMATHPGTPFSPDRLCPDLWVADIVYFPIETELLRCARAKGCRTLDGKGMAVFQAADAFRIFTGLEADRRRMLASFDAFDA